MHAFVLLHLTITEKSLLILYKEVFENVCASSFISSKYNLFRR